MPKDLTARYFLEEFEAEDRLAVVLINRHSESVIQRIASARQLASPESQLWLHDQNRMGYEVYCSPNVLEADARGRTKDDIATIRHIYLDFDEDGTAAVRRMRSSGQVPEPSYLINTSPDRWQAFWRVQEFSKDQAEELQRGMARALGADPAATDCSRVMRVPGLYNHKYPRRHYIRIEQLSDTVYAPEHFPRIKPEERGQSLATSFPLLLPSGRDAVRNTCRSPSATGPMRGGHCLAGNSPRPSSLLSHAFVAAPNTMCNITRN